MDVSSNENMIALLVLVSRLGDVGTTYLVSPKLKLEANPVARKFRWPFAIATLGVALLPYWSVPLALIILVPSLLVSASNAGSAWLVRSLGEEEYFRLASRAAASRKILPTLLLLLIPPMFISIFGLTIIHFYPDPTRDYGYYLGVGVIAYALVLLVHKPIAFFRLRRVGLESGN